MAILAIWCMSLFCPSSVSAADGEYKSLIRYDRVWECIELDDYGRWELKYIKFDGEENISGKIYHRLVTFMRIVPAYDSNKKEYYPYNIEIDLNHHEGYIREENGVVYSPAIVKTGTVIDYDINNYDFYNALLKYYHLCIPNENLSEDEMVIDLPIFDYNKSVLDLCFCQNNIEIGGAYLLLFRIVKDDIIEIDGEKHRCITFQLYDKDIDGEDPKEFYFSAVEGIGLVEGVGALNYQCLIDNRLGVYYHNAFNRLLDLDGNVLYQSSQTRYGSLKVPSFSSVETVNKEDAKSGDIYDMMGRRILEAAPGQLYIRDGKKYIGK